MAVQYKMQFGPIGPAKKKLNFVLNLGSKFEPEVQSAVLAQEVLQKNVELRVEPRFKI